MSQEPLLHWLSALQMHLPVLELYVPGEHPSAVGGVQPVAERTVQSKLSARECPVQLLPEHWFQSLLHFEPVPHWVSLVHSHVPDAATQ